MQTSSARKNRTIAVGLFVAALAVTAGRAAAAWNPNGNVVAAYGNNQLDQIVIPDGAGGAFVVFEDSATSYYPDNDIRAERVDAYGNQLWWMAVSEEPGHQRNPAACFDAVTGGIFVVWEDNRSGNYDIYALRVLPDGTITGWPTGGLAICAQPNNQLGPKVVSDDAGGFIAAWSDNRSDAFGDLYALRVNGLGGDLWANDGVPVSTATYGQNAPCIARDGYGGAVLAWEDTRGVLYSDVDVYAQRLDGAGTRMWSPLNGVSVAFGTYGDIAPRICNDGSGGAYVVWEANPTGSARQVWGQHLNAAGVIQWSSGGSSFATLYTAEAYAPVVTPDGAGGMMLAYQAYQGFIYVSWDVVVQRVGAMGSPSWSVSMGNSFTAETQPAISAAGENGVVVAWRDDRNGNPDIYAQRFALADGTEQWTVGGAAVCVVSTQQMQPEVAVDATGAPIVVWQQLYAPGDIDLYALRLEATSAVYGHPDPQIVSAGDNPNDQGGFVALNWRGSDRDARPQQEITYYSVWRAVDAAAVGAALAPGAQVLFVDPAQVGPDFAGPAYRKPALAGASYYWELVTTMMARYSETYSYNTPTRQDSVAGDAGEHSFQVLSHTADPFVFYESNIVSAHSVDNLAPAPALMLAAQRVGADVLLTWQPSGENEPDFQQYAVYRAPAPGVPAASPYFVGNAGDVTFTDVSPGGGPLYYVVTARDVHGNESVPSNEAGVSVPTGASDTPAFPRALTLLPSAPNPFSTSTQLRFGLPEAREASIEVYDVAGRRVLSRNLGRIGAGWQSVAFDGRDNGGRPLPSGVYFYRLRAGGETQTRKLVIER